MRHILAILLLLCSSAFAKLEAYKNVLSGKAPLTQEVMNSLYSVYKNEFHDASIQKFLL